jgi:pyruvate,orthophosphate dikinase
VVKPENAKRKRNCQKPAVVGVNEIEIDLDRHLMRIGDDLVIEEGEYLSVDSNTGLIYSAKLPTQIPDFSDPYLLKILSWADDIRKLDVRANSDYPEDSESARQCGAKGIGLCRTEHMFFEEERLPIMQKVIISTTGLERNKAIQRLLPMQAGAAAEAGPATVASE